MLTLKSSFPIANDVGATDTLFASILGNELSMRTQGGSSILLRLSARSLVLNHLQPGAALPAKPPAVLHGPARLYQPPWLRKPCA